MLQRQETSSPKAIPSLPRSPTCSDLPCLLTNEGQCCRDGPPSELSGVIRGFHGPAWHVSDPSAQPGLIPTLSPPRALHSKPAPWPPPQRLPSGQRSQPSDPLKPPEHPQPHLLHAWTIWTVWPLAQAESISLLSDGGWLFLTFLSCPGSPCVSSRIIICGSRCPADECDV